MPGREEHGRSAIRAGLPGRGAPSAPAPSPPRSPRAPRRTPPSLRGAPVHAGDPGAATCLGQRVPERARGKGAVRDARGHPAFFLGPMAAPPRVPPLSPPPRPAPRPHPSPRPAPSLPGRCSLGRHRVSARRPRPPSSQRGLGSPPLSSSACLAHPEPHPGCGTRCRFPSVSLPQANHLGLGCSSAAGRMLPRGPGSTPST